MSKNPGDRFPDPTKAEQVTQVVNDNRHLIGVSAFIAAVALEQAGSPWTLLAVIVAFAAGQIGVR